MNKKSIITALLALVAMAGHGQIHYRIEGHIGKPEFTGMMELFDVVKLQRVDTIEVVNGIITPKEGVLPEMALCVLEDTTKVLVQTDSVPYTQSKLSLHWLYIITLKIIIVNISQYSKQNIFEWRLFNEFYKRL